VKLAIFSNIPSVKNRLNKEYELFISRPKGRFSCRAHLITDNVINSSFFKEVMSAITSSSFCFHNFEVLPGGLARGLAGESDKSDESAESS